MAINTKTVKLTGNGRLSANMKEVVRKMRDGWTFRWEQSYKSDPFLNKRGEIEEFTFDVSVLYDLIESGLVVSKKVRSITQYYKLTPLGNTISL